MAVAKGMLISEPSYDVISSGTNLVVPFAYLTFWLSRTSGGLQVPATVYQDGALQFPFPSNTVTANSTGSFPAIYVNPSLPMRVQLFKPSGKLLQDVDPYILNSRFIYTAVTAVNGGRANTTTLAPDPYLTISVPYAGTYRYELQAEFIVGGGSINPGANFGMFLEGGGASSNLFNVLALNGGLLQDVAPPVQIPGGIVTAFAADMVADPSGGTVYGRNAYSATGISGYPITLSTTVHTPVHITGMFTCTGPCILTFAWAQNVSTAEPLELLAGSYLKVQNIQPTVQSGVSITMPLSNKIYSGLLTVATETGSAPAIEGYGNAAAATFPFGSILPGTTVSGTTIAALYTQILTPSNALVLVLEGTIPQNYMPSVTTGGNIYPTAYASAFTQAGGFTTWQWGAPFNPPSWAGFGPGPFAVTMP